ncbi:MAG: response regulator, partial [Peptostreptococcaceae bacterium]
MANKYTVLVVDDAFFMRGVIKRNIMSHVSDDKFEIIGNASSGADGYKMYNELKPDILTTDINLQDSNGLLVAKRIRKENPRSKIIVISSNYDVEVQEEVINAGFIFIKKPFQQASLSEALDKLTKEIEEDKKIPVKPRVEVKNEQDNTNNKQTGQRNLKGGEVREKNKEDKEILQEKKIDGGNTLFKIPSFNDLDKLLSAEINKQEKVSDKNPIEEMAITPIIEDKPKEIKKEDVSKVKKDSLSDDALDENNAFDLNSLNFNFNFLEDNAPKKEEVLENYSLNNSSNNYKYEYEEDRHSHDLDKNLDLEDDFELDLEDDIEEDSFEEDSFEDDLDLEEDFELD